METKQFQTESKRILDLMIHSIYTHKEIFLRELISNGSDAIDKLYFKSLTDSGVGLGREDFKIWIRADKDARTLTISDNGCGMDREQLESNLGTIARSDTLTFKKEHDLGSDIDVIGQFGVGFYAAFMVSQKVTVLSKAYGSDEAWQWESEGVEGYTISPVQKDHFGTEVILLLKEDTEDEKYSEFLEGYRLKSLVKKYSDYIRYPIRMEVEKYRAKDPENEDAESEKYLEEETLNSMIPLWKRKKADIKEEDYHGFYKDKFYDYTDPMLTIHTNAEGASTYNALLYIPSKPPYNYYTKEFQRGLQLYSSGVLIMENCADLLPDYFGFVRGLVDSQDLSLNISRELLQHDRQLKLIEKSLDKKIKSELLKLMTSDREKYNEFFKQFGLPIKFGIYQAYGMNSDHLKDLLVFHSLQENKPVSIEEYVLAMKADQTHIYYASGANPEAISRLPQLELVREKGYDVLCLTEDVDEFVLKILQNWNGKEFMSVTSGDLDFADKKDKKAKEKREKDHKELLEFMRDALGGKVSSVVLSTRLKSHAVCLSSEGDVSLEMEKILRAMPGAGEVKAKRVLELNGDHPMFQTLTALLETDKDKLSAYARILYGQALLIDGLPLEDPVAFTTDITSLL